MITNDERRTIAERIDAIDWDAAEGSWTFIDRLRYAMGVDYMDTYKEDMRAIADKVRKLCKADGLGAMSDEELSAHGFMRLPVGADGEPIRPGDVVTHSDMGGRRQVTSVCLTGEGVSVGCADGFVTLRADLLSHADTPEAQAWADLGPEHAWEHQAAEAFRLYTGRIEAAVRAEEPVRCRDCAHMHENPLLDLPLCLFLGVPVPDAGGFCAWGERRGDAQV
ncbi:hypothetical protein [Olsenella uli]|uniref:hypothetical protein n=1 Tax=Olsenella uli TaxID=133926 RepID=UPI0028E64466|nr:hypothetical protein [Olsenella uli]